MLFHVYDRNSDRSFEVTRFLGLENSRKAVQSDEIAAELFCIYLNEQGGAPVTKEYSEGSEPEPDCYATVAYIRNAGYAVRIERENGTFSEWLLIRYQEDAIEVAE